MKMQVEHGNSVVGMKIDLNLTCRKRNRCWRAKLRLSKEQRPRQWTDVSLTAASAVCMPGRICSEKTINR